LCLQKIRYVPCARVVYKISLCWTQIAFSVNLSSAFSTVALHVHGNRKGGRNKVVYSIPSLNWMMLTGENEKCKIDSSFFIFFFKIAHVSAALSTSLCLFYPLFALFQGEDTPKCISYRVYFYMWRKESRTVRK